MRVLGVRNEDTVASRRPGEVSSYENPFSISVLPVQQLMHVSLKRPGVMAEFLETYLHSDLCMNTSGE